MLELSRLYEPDPREDAPPGPAWDAWRVALLSRDTFSRLGRAGTPSTAQLAYLAAFGLLAPTTHNTVPQRFELREQASEVRVWLDRRVVLADSDPTGRQATVSIGCVVANMELAAEHLGLRAHVEVCDTPLERTRPATDEDEALVELVALRLTSADGSIEGIDPGVDWLELMRSRKMVRARYDESVKLPAAVAKEIDALVRRHDGLRLHLLTDAPTLLFLGKFQELADSTVINRAGFARELGEWLLENDDPSPVGMRGRELGLSDAATRRFRQGLRGELQLLPDEVAGFAKAGNIGMRSASAVGVITVAADDLAHRLAAGRAFEHVALCLLRHGFVVSMHAGITEVEAPNMALRGRLRTRARPEVVFRLGRPALAEDGQRPHASRPTLSSVLLPSRG
jgi:hypothetical protein